jgi:hypothetical protein
VPTFVISAGSLVDGGWETRILDDGHLSVHSPAAGFTMRLTVADAAQLRDQLTAALHGIPAPKGQRP